MKKLNRFFVVLGFKASLVILGTALLALRLIGADQWIMLVAGMAGLREAASFRFAKYKVKEEDESDNH